MFARTVSLQLKPNSVAAFTQIIETDIIPLLQAPYGTAFARRDEGGPLVQVAGPPWEPTRVS